MNEQIQKLAEQAGIQEDLVDHLKDEVEVLTYIARPQDIQKFVELIVQDCVQYLNVEIDRLNEYKNSLPEYSNHSKHENIDIKINKCLDNIQGIQHHFGIEE